MEAFHYTDVAAEPVEGQPGVAIRWAIGKNVGAPHFVLRVIELQRGAATSYHTHAWEHEVFVLEGRVSARSAVGATECGPGTCVYVVPNEEHQFVNVGDSVARFICVIPYPPSQA